MIAKITRGQGFKGLMRYLVDTRQPTAARRLAGQVNVHTLPHLVAGDPAIMTWFDTNELSPADANRIGAELGIPLRARGAGPKAGPVLQCSLSLPPEDGKLTDEQWSEIAHKFLDKMGWSAEASGRSPMPWVAVHHGQSEKGNDHIHLVVSMVREDGTFVNASNNFTAAAKACRELEAEYGLRQLGTAAAGRGERGLHAAELSSIRSGQEPSRLTLERAIREAATAAATEVEFITNVREMGIRIAPYFAQGRNDVVAGYRVGLRGEGQRMFGGGHLSRELSLPRLRERWDDTPQEHLAAAQAWRSADRADRTGAPAPLPRIRTAPGNDDYDRINKALYEQRERLRTLAPVDSTAWAAVAQDTAGILSAWSRKYEGANTPGPIGEAARNVSRLGQIRVVSRAGSQPPRATATGTALLIQSMSVGGMGKVGQAILLRQLMQTMRAMYEAAQAMKELRIAEAIRDSAMRDLTALRESLPALPNQAWSTGYPTIREASQAIIASQLHTTAPAASTPAVGRPLGSPIPNRPAEPAPEPATTVARPRHLQAPPTPNRGIER